MKNTTIKLFVIWGIGIILLMFFATLLSYDNSMTYYFALNILLAIFIIHLIIHQKRHYNKEFIFLQFPVFASIFFFILSNSATISIFFYENTLTYLQTLFNGDDYVFYLNKTMKLTFLSAFVLWISFYATINSKFIIKIKKYFSKWILPSHTINSRNIVRCYCVGIAFRLLMIKLNIYGYFFASENSFEYDSVAQYLNMGESLCLVALMVVALNYYQKKANYLLFLSILGLEIVFGFVSGFKSSVIKPIVLVGFCYYLVYQRIDKKSIVLLSVFLFLAFLIIEPMRNIARSGGVGSIAFTELYTKDNIETAKDISNDENTLPILTHLFLRSHITTVSALCIKYKDVVGMQKGDPDFFYDTIFSPIYAFIPRLIWPNKPIIDYGKWVNNVVLGYGETSSTGTGPVAFLYMAGGIWFIIIGFFLLGFTYRIFMDVLPIKNGWGYVLAYMSIFPTLTQIDSNFYTIFISVIRILPFVILLQAFLIKKEIIEKGS